MGKRKLASIQIIKAIEPIKDKDRIELASILGWHVIVGKGDFKVGDLVIYVEYDTILPVKPEFEFLRSRAYSKKYDGFRVRNMRMAGVFSEGIVFPLSIIEDNMAGNWKIEGQNVSNVLEVRKYDPEELTEKTRQSKNPIIKYMMRYKWFRKLVGKRKSGYSYPEGLVKADEDNIQVKFDKLKDKPLRYYKSEKIEGQAASYLIQKGKFKVFSHGQGLPKSNNNWWNVAIKYDIESKMRLDMKRYKLKSLFIQGEIAGPGIQKNVYKFDSLEFFIYDVGTLEEGKFGFNDLLSFCCMSQLKSVPILEAGVPLLDSSDEIIKDSEGKSIVNKNITREGIVWRAMDNSTGFKAKSQKYANWFNKSDKTE